MTVKFENLEPRKLFGWGNLPPAAKAGIIGGTTLVIVALAAIFVPQSAWQSLQNHVWTPLKALASEHSMTFKICGAAAGGALAILSLGVYIHKRRQKEQLNNALNNTD